MAKGATTPTRVAADIAATAAAIAHEENRSATEQINYWARIGMQIERASTVSYRKVLAVAAGNEQFSTLSEDERAAAHAVIDARIAQRTAKHRVGPALRRAGQATVSLDDDGHLIEIAPDGSRRRL